MEGYQRIQKILEYYKLNKSSFSKAIGYTQNSTINRIIKERRKPSKKTLEKILQKFPEISYDWLFYDRGSMFIKDEKKQEKIKLFTAEDKIASTEEVAAYFFQNLDELKQNPIIELLLKTEGQAIAIELLKIKEQS